MVVNRYALAHAKPFDVRYLPFTVRPWMMWFFAMFLYNLGATALASVAQLFIPLSLFACLFITLLVVNIILARALLKEVITPPKVLSAILIMAGAILAGAGTPVSGAQLQETYPCGKDGGDEMCVYEHVRELASAPEAIALQATLGTLVVLSVIAIICMEIKYPASDLKRTGPAKSPPKKKSTTTKDAKKGEEKGEASSSAAPKPSARPPRLAPRWLERVMAFVYPASMGLDEGIAHLWLRADTSMLTQCNLGGCANSTFATAIAVRWSASVATTFWLIVVFRRYETTVALPIEYGTCTAIDVISGLLFYKEYMNMEPWQLGCVIGGCVVCVIGVAVGIFECAPAMPSVEEDDSGNRAAPSKKPSLRFQPSLPRLSHVVNRDVGDDVGDELHAMASGEDEDDAEEDKKIDDKAASVSATTSSA